MATYPGRPHIGRFRANSVDMLAFWTTAAILIWVINVILVLRVFRVLGHAGTPSRKRRV